ncbi:MAG: flagellar hook protein FlgE [Firmicutes bacterium]|nr:flagellar hook protein FlgE [Bacillota bacterium]
MMRSMYSGVAGLRNHQIRMDAIGNNIANVNTYGYKSSRVSFQDALNQTLRGASAPSPDGSRGGINALQIGLGMNVACIDILQTQGSLQNTGKITDCAIQGDGFFILTDGQREWYTRAGNFQMERDGRLVCPSNGLLVRGWMADSVGNINTNASPTEIQLPVGQIIAPLATTEMELSGLLHPAINGDLSYTALNCVEPISGANCSVQITITPTGFNTYSWTLTTNPAVATIANGTGTITIDPVTNLVTAVTNPGGPPTIDLLADALPPETVTIPVIGAANGGTFTIGGAFTPATAQGAFDPVQPLVTSTTVYDSLGVDHVVTTTITKIATNSWSWSSSNELGTVVGNGVLSFDNNGKLIGATTVLSSPDWITWTPVGANTLRIVPDFSGIRQDAEAPLREVNVSPTEIISPYQNGYAAGHLQGFNIDKLGVIVGVFSNGINQNLGQLALANFNNPGGLIRSGDTLFEESNNSGPAMIGRAGNSGRGLVTPGAIEMSNVDLSAEFTDMITTERGFQANSRIITTSDEMLQELVNLKR